MTIYFLVKRTYTTKASKVSTISTA